MASAPPLSLLLLADGRFPAGGHAHSAGVEAAVHDGRVRDVRTLEDFTRARLWTAGLVDASLAAATVTALHRPASSLERQQALRRLDGEADARLPAPPLRAASRRLGRQLVRVAARCWPEAVLAEVTDLEPDGVHQSVAMGAVAVAAGADAAAAAALAVHHAIATPTQAAVKLLGLDPFEVAALAARLATEADGVVTHALGAAGGLPAELPARSSPLVEIAAVEHRGWSVRMFAT